MSSRDVGIEEARKRLGDLVTAARQGTDIILTRNGKPAARLIAYVEEPVITVAELAATAGTTPEKFARFAGAMTEHDPRTGRLPQRWAGQGLGATFTRDEADGLLAEWDTAARYVEAGAILPYVNEAETEADRAEIAERYRP